MGIISWEAAVAPSPRLHPAHMGTRGQGGGMWRGQGTKYDSYPCPDSGSRATGSGKRAHGPVMCGVHVAYCGFIVGLLASGPGAVSMWAMCRHVASWEMTRSRVDCATEVIYSPSHRSSVPGGGGFPDVRTRGRTDRAMVALV